MLILYYFHLTRLSLGLEKRTVSISVQCSIGGIKICKKKCAYSKILDFVMNNVNTYNVTEILLFS